LKYNYRLSAFLFFAISLIFLSGCSKDEENPVEPKYNGISKPLNPFEQNSRLGRGVNIGNALEAPKEGDWGVTIEDEYFTYLKEKGFNSVRIPIKWSAHASETSPYTINQQFFERIDHIINKALDNNLAVIINVHHYDEMMTDPANHIQRLIALWKQISERYVQYPAELFFELLNEPNNKLGTELWNQYLAQLITAVREKNPYRTIIIGPANWNNVDYISSLQIPKEEINVIVTFHYYNPFQFTHQGANWVDGSNSWLGTTWSNKTSETAAIQNDFDKALNWSIANNRPINIGEFGAFNKADITSRVKWTTYVSRAAEQKGFSWNYWEFCSGFGFYDPNTNEWNTKLLNALNPALSM